MTSPTRVCTHQEESYPADRIKTAVWGEEGPITEPSESALMAQWQERLSQGDLDVIAPLYDHFAPSLYRVLAAILGAGTDAEDALQEVFVGLAQGRAKRVHNLRAYLFTAARNEARTLLRRRGRECSWEATDNAVQTVQHTDTAEIQSLLQRLPVEQREVIAMKIYEEMTFAEMMFRMSEHLAPEPLLISGLVTMAIERRGYTTLSHILKTVSLSPEQAHAFALRLPHTDWIATLHRDMEAERCFGLWAFQYVSNPLQAAQLLNGPSTPSFSPTMKALSVLWSPFWKLDEIQYLHAIDRRSVEFQRPGAPLISEEDLTKNMPWYAICSRVMLPDLVSTARKRDHLLAHQRMALVALAIHSYYTSFRHYPPDLHTAEIAWGEAFPHDLSNGQPFLYKTDGEKMSLSATSSAPGEPDGKQSKQTGVDGAPADSGDDLVW
jgi:RNA polymerase sigma-70 factor (ECF subfamily)